MEPPCATVAVYFGTFDPIHENHVRIANHALSRGYADRVYLIVNGDSSMKPGASPWHLRQRLVMERLATESNPCLQCLELTEEELAKMDWKGRDRICARVKQQTQESKGGRVKVVQLMGQDAFENAVTRGGIFRSRGHDFLVFPRGGAGAAALAEVPGALEGRVTLVADYSDELVLSSTEIRAALASPLGPGAELLSAGAVHPGLRAELGREYAAAPEGQGEATACESFLMLLMGGPGSGKTSLGRSLRTLGFTHVSGGDVFRAAQSFASGSGRRRGREEQEQLVARILGAVSHAVSSLQRRLVSFDGFLPKDLRDFEARVGKVALLVELQCSAETMRCRLENRGARSHDVARERAERVAHYLSERQQSLNSQMLKSFDSGRQVLHQLDVEGPWEATHQRLVELVRKVATARGVELLDAGSDLPPELDHEFWKKAMAKLEADPRRSYNSRKNASSMKERGGSRALKNVHNLIKSALIDWAMGQVAKALWRGRRKLQHPCVEVFDVASGRGGDQMKFVKAAEEQSLQLCYNGMDVAEEQVAEAHRRLLLARDRSECSETLRRARLFVGDMVRSAPGDLPWQHVVSIQFALQYSFSTEETACAFLRHAVGRLATDGLLLVTTVDTKRLAELACSASKRVRDDGTCVAENSLFRMTFPDQELARRLETHTEDFGLRYHFALSSEGISGEEYAVPEALLRRLLDELDVELLHSLPFAELLHEADQPPWAAWLVGALLRRLGARLGAEHCGKYSVYDRLGLAVSQDEAEVVSLYRAFIGRRRQVQKASAPHLVKAAAQASSRLTCDGPPAPGDVLAGLPPEAAEPAP